jgi:hypothetical protein
MAGLGPIITAPPEDELEIIEREALPAGHLMESGPDGLSMPHASCGDWTDGSEKERHRT